VVLGMMVGLHRAEEAAAETDGCRGI